MNLLTPDTISHKNFYDKAKYLMAWRLSLTISITLFILSIVVFINYTSLLPTSITVSMFLISTLSFIYLKTTNNYMPVFWTYVIAGSIMIHIAMNMITEIPHYGDFIWVVAVILLSYITLGERIGIIFTLLHFIAISYFYFFTVNQHIAVLQPRMFSDKISDIIDNAFSFFLIIYLLKQYLSFQRYAEDELLKANKFLEQKNKENAFLLKEIHHRVKNNLQIIISLLRLQKEDLTQSQSKQNFDGAINRIMTMSLIHKKLYQTEALSTINIKSYIEELIQEIISSISTSKLITNIKTDSESIGLKTIVPFGLLLNELISNSIKHAFSESEKWVIDININKTSESEFEFIYKDSGKWKEPLVESKQFGLGLIETLTDQLEGTMNRVDSTYIFTLKNLDI